MDKAKILLITVLVLSIASFSNASNIIYVDVNGPNNPGSGTLEDPFRQIQAGINTASSGDTVQIQQGIYTGIGNCNLDPNGKAITIRSTDPEDSNIVANTIIDPNGTGRGFYLRKGEDANCVISGLTIKNARITTGYNGAGIYCFNSSPIFRNCIIKNSRATGSGGGICFDYGSASVINCIIMGNTADYYGGGISCRFSSPLLIGCTINGNIAYGRGGGIDSGESDPNIINCVIINNYAPVGGGINCYYPGVANVINCTLANNLVAYDYGVGGAVYCQYEGNANIKNSILWANTQQLGLEYESSVSVTYCDLQGGQADVYDPCGLLAWGQGNIDIDPCFALFDLDEDPNLWDFHLQSAYGRWDPNSQDWVYDVNISPCIDAGDPNSDWTDEPWPNGKRINMGAYGGTTQASMNGNPADFDINGYVNFADFAEFADKWLAQESCIEDLKGDGIVEFADLEMFAENWLWQRE
ncbi:MAG: hypothetical protein WAK60_08055 [Sedimentisphaerales bacterium]